MESTSICLRASQTILSCYQKILQPSRNKRSLPPTWRQAMRLVSCSCILLLSLWREEITKMEAQRDLNVAMSMLRGFRERWDPAAGEMLRLLERLMRASGEYFFNLFFAQFRKALTVVLDLEVDEDSRIDVEHLQVNSVSMVTEQSVLNHTSTHLPAEQQNLDELSILQNDSGLLDPLWLMPDGWEFDRQLASEFLPLDDVNSFSITLQ